MACPTETPQLPADIERDRNTTRLITGALVVEAQRVWYGRWRVASGPLVDGRPDRTVTWTEHGFHDTRTAAEAQTLAVAS